MDNPVNGHVPGPAAPTTPPLPDANALACRCGHPLADHDAIAARYCLATANGQLDRGCICADIAAPQA